MIVGVAVTLAPVDALREADGAQVYVLAPPAFRLTLPEQRVEEAGVTVTMGALLTVIVMVCVPIHPLVLPVTV